MSTFTYEWIVEQFDPENPEAGIVDVHEFECYADAFAFSDDLHAHHIAQRRSEWDGDTLVGRVQLTDEESESVEMDLADMLHWNMDEIATELGLPTQDVREWTEEEAARIIAEHDSQYKPSVFASVLEGRGD